MLASLLSKPQPSLSMQAKRLVAMRFLIYTGFQTSYFIGVIGTLTYADDASVVATSLAVLFMNVFVILGSFAGGAALDAWGPRRHFLLSIVGTLATGTAIIAFGSATGVVLLGAVFLGFTMGFAQPIATSYPAYLTDDPVELKDINSAIAMFSNVSIIVGPTLGGFVAAAASSRAVFVLMMLFTVLAFVVGWGFRPQTSHVAGHADADSTEEGERAGQSSNPSTSARATFAASIKTVFTNSVLALLFCIIFLSNFGYGAFDPLESFFYRDVLRVGVEWMGWLSSASGVGAVLVPCSRSACRRTWSTLKRCSWRSCPWAWEVCSMWGRRTWAWPSSARSPWALLGVSSTRSTTPLCKRRLRSSSLVASIRSWALAICSLAWPLWQLPRGWRQHLAYNGHSWGQAWS